MNTICLKTLLGLTTSKIERLWVEYKDGTSKLFLRENNDTYSAHFSENSNIDYNKYKDRRCTFESIENIYKNCKVTSFKSFDKDLLIVFIKV